METEELSTPVQTVPPVVNINGIDCVTAPDAKDYLGVHYSTVVNLINSRQRYLVAEKIGSTLFVTLESLETEKERRARLGLGKEKEVAQ